MKWIHHSGRRAALLFFILSMLLFSGCGTSAGSQKAAAAETTPQPVSQETAAPAETGQPQTDAAGSADFSEPMPGDTEPASAEAPEAAEEASAREEISAAATPRNTGRGNTAEADSAAEDEQTAAVTENTIAPLAQQVQAQVKGFSGTWSVYFKRLDTGESFAVNDTAMVAASLIKLYIYGAAAQQIEKGRLPASYYSSTMLPMISVSDNTAANTMIDAVGGMDAVNRFIKAQGWKQSQLNRRLLSSDPVENYTSGSECGALLEQVYKGTYVSKTASENLLDAMLSQTRRTKIPAGLPSGTKCANKTGELSDVENDAAIVYSPKCTYILVVMSDGIASGTAQSNIAAISGTVYAYLNP